VMEAQVHVQATGEETTIREAVADKGYHAAKMIELCDALGVRTYIPEPSRKHRRRWTDKPPEFQRCVDANRRRVTGERGRRLSRRRSELAERSFAHVCETGGARRCWLHGLAKVTKRYLIQAAARNLGLILRTLLGVGTARSLQGLRGLAALVQFIASSLQCLLAACLASFAPTSPHTAP